MSELPEDPLTAYLIGQGAPYAIVASGLLGLVENWERIVGVVVSGYPLGLDDYLNDMDGRQMLENALELVPVDARRAFVDRVRNADHRMLEVLMPAGRCLWGGIAAEDEGWTPERNWWYFQIPKQPGERLGNDLETA